MNSPTGFQPFPDTHWSLVRRAGVAEGESRREALAVLLARYQPALNSYLRIVRRLSPEDAEELLQGFIAEQLLQRDLLQRADASRGRFRSLLLASLNNFAASRYRSQRLRETDSLDFNAAGTGHSPAAVMEAAWARTLIHQTVELMRQQCLAEGRADIWAVFEGRVLAEIIQVRPPVAYEELAQRFGLKSPGQAANLLVTAKRMYARLLRAAVAEYEREDIDGEIADLQRVLAEGGNSQGQEVGDAHGE